MNKEKDILPAAGSSRRHGEVSVEDAALMSDDVLISMALQNNPQFGYARVNTGLSFTLKLTRCISFWRNKECYLAGDERRAVIEGFPTWQGALASVPPQAETDVCGAPQGEGE